MGVLDKTNFATHLTDKKDWFTRKGDGASREFKVTTTGYEEAGKLSLAFEKAVRDAGLPRIRLHDLRHTHVALLARAGIPPKVIQERVGHHSAGFTLDNYGGTFPSQHQEAARRFAVLVNEEGR
jgi:integrase